MNKFEIFKLTIPVMMGYVPLGLAFGLYGVGAGLPAWVMTATSVLVYAGSVEFMLVAFIVGGASVADAFIVSFLLNFRHFFYTTALLDEIKGLKRRFYFIYALTDETFALLKSRGVKAGEDANLLFNFTAILNHGYWIFGVSAGAILGSNLNIEYKGIEFSLVALFAVLTYEIYRANPVPRVLGLALGCSIAGLFLLPSQYFLFGAILSGIAVLLAFRRYF